MADQLLELHATDAMRRTHLQLERRHPAESRLAVQWVQRFEAYYRIWTPVWSLAADLTAYRSTLLEEDRPYDEQPPEGSDVPAYTQEDQAEGYATMALYRYAWFEWSLRQFVIQHGGMWLLSDHRTEDAVQDALYRISWHVTPLNERDQSWLRSLVSQSQGQEMDHALRVLQSSSVGRRIHQEWQEWVAECPCTWNVEDEDTSKEPFATSQRHPGISAGCQMHQTVQACGEYVRLIDGEWYKVADWYHLEGVAPRARPTSWQRYELWKTGNAR